MELGIAVMELHDAAAFAAIADASGQVSIAGFGSLLSERSARYTFPGLRNFRVGRIRSFRRVFAHLAPIFFERGIARPETKEVSSLSVEPHDGESIVVSVFEIAQSEVPAFIERESEFRFVALTPENLSGSPMPCKAVVCSRYSDEEYRRVRLKGSEEAYERMYGRWGIQKIWDDDVLPCRTYLRHCVLAAKGLGDDVYSSFLDHTYLSDRVTTIRSYLAQKPDIMEELPPESLRERYGG